MTPPARNICCRNTHEMLQVRSVLALLTLFAGSASAVIIQGGSDSSYHASVAFVSSVATLRHGQAHSSLCRLGSSFTPVAVRRQRVADVSQRNAVILRMGLNEELWNAAEYGFENDVAELVEKGADIHAANENESGKQALHFAAGQGHALAVAKLLELGADPDCKTEIGSGPLHLAAAYGHFTVITYLLQYGANPVMENIDGDTPLKIAKFKGRYSDRVDFVHVVEVLEKAASKVQRR